MTNGGLGPMNGCSVGLESGRPWKGGGKCFDDNDAGYG